MSYSLEISAIYGISFLKDRGYHTYLATATSLRRPTVSLRSHKACPLPGL